MSRFYHVLNDPRKCIKCNAACAIFGERDPETSWHYWCTLCNKTWHNRNIESTLFAVSRTFAKHSIATLVGGENTALAVLTFLQISIDCIRYNYHLRHRLETQVLEWICCPLAWYYESDRERIFHPTLRTLQETFIHSTTFKATCFPCSGSDKPWTLLHAVCTFVKNSSTTHSCGTFPKRERTWRMFRWAHKPWIWNETTNEYFYINNPPAEWKCHSFHRRRQKIHYWTTGKRWFLEPINPKWSFILRAGLDIGETGWQFFLSYNGAWMKNKETDEFFLTKDGFSQSITAGKGPWKWKQGTCSDQKGNWTRYWFSGNRWFLEPQPSEEGWKPPPGGELLWLDSDDCQSKLAWGISGNHKTIPRIDETGKWQAFDSTDGKGTWWWHELTNEWFLEIESGTWTQLNDRNNQPHWCHPDGRSFCASLEPWLIDEDTLPVEVNFV